MKLKKIITFFAPKLLICLIILGIILAPKSAIKAAKDGISIWINILMPSLLPFIIGANLIVSLKIVDILGILINPLTKKNLQCKWSFWIDFCYLYGIWISCWFKICK